LLNTRFFLLGHADLIIQQLAERFQRKVFLLESGEAAFSRRGRVENGDRQAAEVCGIEPEEPRNTVTLHGSYQASIVRSEAGYTVGLDQCLPEVAQVWTVGKQRESSPEEA
jgi:hypothetical protein